MSEITVRDQVLEIDVRAELESFDWMRPTWTGDKLLAASPFREDRTPSFFVRLESYGDYPAGVWSDQGAYDDEYRSGNLVTLLAFMRNETYEEAEDYLLSVYGYEEGQAIALRPKSFRLERSRQALDEDVIFAPYRRETSEYLTGRGISADVQREAGILDGGNKVIIPWRTASGNLANVKYRSVRGKLFWYERGAIPIRELVYGIEAAATVTVVCEAEIDALSWREAGYAAIAVGGVAFNKKKRDIIVRSAAEEIIIATDNDKAGEKLREDIAKELRGYMRIKQARIVADCKDANDALVKYGAESLRRSAAEAEAVRRITPFRL